jgi:hypothetical protein
MKKPFSGCDITRKTWKAYMHNKIKDAARTMPSNFSKEFLRAFEATGAEDIYGGEPIRYMQVIAQTIERQNETIEKQNKRLLDIRALSDEIIP